jgi:formylglycine-generating enzyme required for sulfatase activity
MLRIYLPIALLYAGLSSCGNAAQTKRSDPLAARKTDNAVYCGRNGANIGKNEANENQGQADFLPTVEATDGPGIAIPNGMQWIPGGEFSMGSNNPTAEAHGGPDPMRDARPIHRVRVRGFFMDKTEVTNKEFAAFVAATGYVTVAEKKPTQAEFPDAPAENLVAGSVVFTPAHVTSLDDHYQWWRYVAGANWRHPEGPDSDLKGRDNYPVVHIAWEDAAAYAHWAHKRLPTEAEWEFAARGGKTGEVYSWGNDFKPSDQWMANTYQGSFPASDAGNDGFRGLAPAGSFRANAYGLYDMAGNVWEWCSDWYRPDYYQSLSQSCTANPKGPATAFDPYEPTEQKKVQRGGSFLCTDQYCTRYMIGSRGKGEFRSASNHVGFRCVQDYPTQTIAKM